MTLFEIYQLAKLTQDFPEFEHIIKSKLTGLPTTQVIEGKVAIIMIPEDVNLTVDY